MEMLNENSKQSSMRAAFIITVINGNLIGLAGAIYSIYKTGSIAEGLGVLVGTILGAAFVGKGGQKFAEKLKEGK